MPSDGSVVTCEAAPNQTQALPELFGAVRAKHPGLTVRDFHDGLRRLADNHAIRLTPWAGPGAIPQPEYALMADGRLMYHVGR